MTAIGTGEKTQFCTVSVEKTFRRLLQAVDWYEFVALNKPAASLAQKELTMSRQTRRTFLKQATAAGIASSFVISGTQASGRVIGANDRISIGVAGINGRGGAHINEFAKMPDVDVTYLIDPDSRLFASRSNVVKDKGGNTPKCVQDIRDALDDKSLDAVSVATCNHWHALITFWACQAGKDVYVEKPCSHNVFEGRQCVKAARKYNRIVSHGTQSRSSGSWAKTVAAIASGKYGKLLVSKGYASKGGRGRFTVGYKPITDPPTGFDFNLWLGPAQEQPYHENIVHYNWHWFWDFGNGEIGNQGVHQMDIARWGIPGATLPKSVVSMGGRWTTERDHKDQAQTPNMHSTVFDFGGTLLVFEVASLCGTSPITKKKVSGRVTNEFYLEEGKIIGGKFYPNGSDKGESLGDVKYEDKPGGSIFQNFIHCMRTRNTDELDADILDAHYSSALCHLGNTAYRVGEQVPGADRPAGFPDVPQVNESVEWIRNTLKDFLDLDLSKTTYQLSPVLKFDAEKEQFVNNDAANKLLTRDYREPFVVTEEV
jgi:predicted dehydrogenase